VTGGAAAPRSPDRPRRILLLHTGGTLGMHGAPLRPETFTAGLTERVPEIGQLAELDTRVVCNLDSSDVGPAEWVLLAEAVAAEREAYDGFVVIHGTDTMAYTASALAFALGGLDRPVILTGAQRPLGALRTDARRNLVDAVELATRAIPEVGICFDGLLLRGCRATKSHAHDYRAFESPGCPPLARLGVDVDVAAHVRRPTAPFSCDARFDPAVLVVFVTPGMGPELLRDVLEDPVPPRGLVLAAFGSGTIPSRVRPLAPVVAEAIAQRGVEVLVITQAGGHVDLSLYENSRPLLEAGAVEGGSMGVEAAVTKLMHALATRPDRPDRRRYLETDVAGERH
jgi:L-asparaginase